MKTIQKIKQTKSFGIKYNTKYVHVVKHRHYLCSFSPKNPSIHSYTEEICLYKKKFIALFIDLRLEKSHNHYSFKYKLCLGFYADVDHCFI